MSTLEKVRTILEWCEEQEYLIREYGGTKLTDLHDQDGFVQSIVELIEDGI